MGTKIHLRAGEVELSLETESPLAVSDIKEFISQVQGLAQSLVPEPDDTAPLAPSNGANGTASSSTTAPLLLEHTNLQLHVNSVADRLSVKSGPELVIAAAAYLQIVEGRQSFTRKELLETMKSATSHYNQNIGSNLGAALKSLSTSKLNQLNNGTYALKSHELAALRSQVAERS
ncbi:hypothetical protein [Sphingobium agri]|jgi:hypothetical protein|uniref:Uncharacterized protein n=1 Tax=Sphingobium agri TaxID=2933566 RepID=A0ABT0DUF1_9SPHN|nr:hypothetical protein [Sphingobium agri]MCK0530738.1 hypothetical protein [Sphingobium agri]